MTYTIEKNIPIPFRGDNLRKYPFHEMGVGDSFLSTEENWPTVRAAAFAWAQANGKKFCSRKTKEGLRIWRVT